MSQRIREIERARIAAKDRAKTSPNRDEPWTPERQTRSQNLGDAWKAWLAAERERRGSPSWQPF